jgi:hypothetical protein
MFDYLDYKNRIPLDKCLIDIKDYNPLSIKYEVFWIHNIFRKVIEGYWVSHTEDSGETIWKWIPGPLFQYVNLWHIEMGEAEAGAAPVIGKPRLRDIEWIKGFVHAQAMGFSGFAEDDEFTCNRLLLEPDFQTKVNSKWYKKHKPYMYKKDGTLKEYKDALEYLYEYQDRNLGKPLYHNQVSNVIDIECRNIGKSKITGNFAGHMFLTDGVKDYDEWYEENYTQQDDQKKKKYKIDTLLAAIEGKYVNGLVNVITTGFKNLPGGREVNDRYYPPPLSKTTKGEWKVGKEVTASVAKNVGGKWLDKGSESRFIMRSFSDSTIAANSGRYGLAVIDEVGFMGNLLGATGQLDETMTKNGWKFGCQWDTGTGGAMDGGATEAVKKKFYAPKSFKALTFRFIDETNDTAGKETGFFVPAWMALDEWRDEFGNVDKEAALKVLMEERRLASESGEASTLNILMQMKPLVPSEAFLVSGSNDFPVATAIKHLKWLEDNEGSEDALYYSKGELIMDASQPTGVAWVEDVNNKLTPTDYPVKKNKYYVDLAGAVEIYEHPIAGAQYGWYIGGLDPFNKVGLAPESTSLGSFVLLKRGSIDNGGYDEEVCHYTARPDDTAVFYETVRRILLYYGQNNSASIVLHENNFNYIVGEFEKSFSLHLLAKRPTVMDKSVNKNIDPNEYGFRTSNKEIKEEGLNLLKDWMNKPIGASTDKHGNPIPPMIQLQKIRNKALLREIIAYNEEGNFDRVIALMLAVIQARQMHKILVEQAKEPVIDKFFQRKLFVNTNKLQRFGKYV